MSVQWFDQWLRDKDSGITKQKPVELFVLGENTWQTFDQWPPKAVEFEPWYLQFTCGVGLGVAFDLDIAACILSSPFNVL